MAKKHISLWLEEDVLKKCDANIKLSKLKNRSEFIETAVEFYNGYLHNQVNESFIGKTLMKIFQSTMDSFEKRMARQMFKQAVEVAKVFWLVVRGLGLNPEDVDDLHSDCVEEVRTINGAIRFPYKNRDGDA